MLSFYGILPVLPLWYIKLLTIHLMLRKHVKNKVHSITSVIQHKDVYKKCIIILPGGQKRFLTVIYMK